MSPRQELQRFNQRNQMAEAELERPALHVEMGWVKRRTERMKPK